MTSHLDLAFNKGAPQLRWERQLWGGEATSLEVPGPAHQLPVATSHMDTQLPIGAKNAVGTLLWALSRGR